ncbi:MAG TPA: hypothetical protein VJU78_14525 [Chitinophagaceae bacterium]|nr:hypothetical protein [Chitinophagaceae bacterium]
MTRKKKLTIDSLKGGNGDIWMRLVSFYSIAGLLPHLEISILIPGFLRSLAKYTFGDRLTILENSNEKIRLQYSSAGMRHLIKGFAEGYRYILPYQRAVIKDKKKQQAKDNINILLFNIAQKLGFVQIPDWKWINSYQGYLDIIGLNVLKQVSYDFFVEQLCADFHLLYAKLNGNIPRSAELEIPGDLNQNILVFPTGTSRQFIPVWWAKKNLPDAYFAFFYKDKDASVFEKSGLKTIKFYHEPGDIIILANNASWTISTDSFPSHLLQSATKNCTVTITEVLKSRIVSPAFKGKVAGSVAACHPCLHLDRKNHPLCAAGHSECINWKSKIYTENILHSVTRSIGIGSV